MKANNHTVSSENPISRLAKKYPQLLLPIRRRRRRNTGQPFFPGLRFLQSRTLSAHPEILSLSRKLRQGRRRSCISRTGKTLSTLFVPLPTGASRWRSLPLWGQQRSGASLTGKRFITMKKNICRAEKTTGTWNSGDSRQRRQIISIL